jgi:Fe-S cluster assembly iron-binding protein IscA
MKISNNAVNIVKDILDKNQCNTIQVQIVEGCCGPSVALSIAKATESDILVIENGIQVLYVEDAEAQTLQVVLEEKEGSLFLNNPNASC